MPAKPSHFCVCSSQTENLPELLCLARFDLPSFSTTNEHKSAANPTRFHHSTESSLSQHRIISQDGKTLPFSILQFWRWKRILGPFFHDENCASTRTEKRVEQRWKSKTRTTADIWAKKDAEDSAGFDGMGLFRCLNMGCDADSLISQGSRR